MSLNDSFSLLKAAGLVSLGGLVVSAVFYLKAPKPLPPRLPSHAPAPTLTASLEPLQPEASSAGALSSNPRPIKARIEPGPGGETAAPVNFTGIDQQYHDALLAGLDASDIFAQEAALCDKLGEWIRQSPTSVEASVTEISQRYGANPALRVTAQLWAEEDPEGAREWALRSGNGGQRLKILASLSYQLAQRDPLAAVENVKAELERTPYYEAATAPLVARWARKDRAAALAWVNAQTGGDIHKQLLWQIERATAPADPVLVQQP